jgi:hypothetical protein
MHRIKIYSIGIKYNTLSKIEIWLHFKFILHYIGGTSIFEQFNEANA